MGSIGTDIRLNDGLTGVANSMYQSINHLVSGFERLNDASGLAFDNSAFIQAQQGFAQSIAMINQYEQELNRASQAQTELQWNSISTPEIFNTTGIGRTRQELTAAEQAARRVITNQSLISTFASRMNILPPGAQREITNVNTRVGNLGNTIQRLEREQRRLARWDTSGINQYNNRIESLRNSMGQIERFQEDINRAVSNNDAGRLNSSYRQLNSIMDQTEREIRNSDTAQQRLNNSIAGGTKKAGGLLNVYAAINLAQQGFRVGKQFVSSTFGEGFNLSKIKSQFQARLGDDELGSALYKRISEQAKVSAYDINSLAKNTASFLSVAQNTQQLDKLNKFAEQLALFDTTGQGLQGAGFSLKEALSGDIISLAERFNMSKSLIRAFGIDKLGKSGDIDGFITQFEKLLDAQRMGSEAYEKMLKDPKVQFDMFTSNMKTGFAEASQSAVNSLSPIITGLNEWFASDSAANFFNKLSDGFQWITGKGMEFSSWLKQTAVVVGPSLSLIAGYFLNVGRYIFSASGLLGTLGREINKVARSTGFQKMAAQVAGAGLTIAKGISWAMEAVTGLNERFGWLLPTIATAAIGLTTFNTVNSLLTPVLNGVGIAVSVLTSNTSAMALASRTAEVAQRGLNAAMDANPYWAVARAVMAVVSAIGSMLLAIKEVNKAAGIISDIGANDLEVRRYANEHGYSNTTAQQILQLKSDFAENTKDYTGYKEQINEIKNKMNNASELESITGGYSPAYGLTKEEWNNRLKDTGYYKDLEKDLNNIYKDPEYLKAVGNYEERKAYYSKDLDAILKNEDNMKKLSNSLNNIKTDFDLPGGYDGAGFDSNIGSVGNVGNVDKINTPVDIESEDLKFMKEIAEQESINKYITTVLSPEFKVTFGDVKETADVNKLADAILGIIEEDVLASVEGLHI